MSNNRQSVRRPAGISLIEMLVCLTLLAIVALALANGMMASMSGTSTTEERAAAIRAAEQKLARLIGFGRNIVAPSTAYPNLEIDPSNGVIKNVRAFNNAGADITDTGVTWTAGTVTATFDVTYTKVDSAGRGNDALKPSRLPVLNGGDTLAENQGTGELVVWFSEVDPIAGGPRTGATYGRDLTGGPPTTACPMGAPDGKPDGVNFDFASVGYDLDMDGSSTTVDITNSAVDCYNNNVGRVPIGAIVRWFGCDGRAQRVEVWSIVDFSNITPADQAGQ